MKALSNKIFGNPAFATMAIQLSSAWIPGQSSPSTSCWIAKQVGTSKYVVTDGTNVGVCALAAPVSNTAPSAGTCVINVTNSSGGTEHIRKLMLYTLYTWEDNTYRYNAFVPTTATSATIALAGTVYVPGNTVTLAGGVNTSTAVLTVATTQVVSATVAGGGTGGTNGTQTVTGTTGTGTKFQASVTVSGGAITAVLSITVSGSYTVNPTLLTAEPVTGASLTGATLNIIMGVGTVTVTNPGAYTIAPLNPVSQASTNGSGTGAKFNLVYAPVNANQVSLPLA